MAPAARDTQPTSHALPFDKQHGLNRLIQLSGWFADLSSAEQQQLLALAQYRKLNQGQRLFCRGDAFDGIYVLLNGGIFIAGVDKNGKEALLTLVEGGDFIGEIALFDKKSRTHDATAGSDVELLWWPAHALSQLLTQYPLWWQRFGLLLSTKIRLVFQAFEDMSLQSAHVRLARRLVLFCQQQPQAEQCVIPISQEQLGQLLGLSRQTTNQLLSELQNSGYILKSYGQIKVIDAQALKRLVDEF